MADPSLPPVPARRVRVVHPRTDAARRSPQRSVLSEIEDDTELGSVFVQSMIRAQRRAAVRVCAVLFVILGGVLLGTAAAPRLSQERLLGIPWPWLVLGVLVYPVLIALGWYAVRSAERHERDFEQLVRER